MTFKSGESGNPCGRPTGSKNKRPKLAKLLEPHAEELINKVLELARDGDINALRLCVERLIPKITHEPIELNFNAADLNTNGYLIEFNKQVLMGVAKGEIMPEAAKILSSIVDNHRKMIEHGELKLMLKEIELAIKRGHGK